MKKLFLLSIILITSFSYAQMMNGHLRADKLDTITVTGKAIVDQSTPIPQYFIDTNLDGNADYHLNFGPSWYQPDSSAAQRPKDGDQIKIVGGVYQSSKYSFKSVVVYEINDLLWRDPFFADWNDMGKHNHMFGWDKHGMFGGSYGFGWNHDTLKTVTLTGTALVDTTFFMAHYYLDTDNDSKPNYFLNLGPYWYQPASGAKRPNDGETVTIKGGLLSNNAGYSMLIVYEINGQVWRDSTKLGSHFGGGWFNQSSNSTKFHSPFDDSSMVTIMKGWHQSGNMMGSMPDSVFGQMFEVYPENMPNFKGQNIFAGFEVDMFNPNETNMMWQNGRSGGHMDFGNNLHVQLHFTDAQLNIYNMNKNTIQVKLWDDQTSSWKAVTASVDKQNNTVSFSTSTASGFIALTGSAVTSVKTTQTLPTEFSLSQNYPNPFNPSTTISYQLLGNENVSLKVYDVLGNEVATLFSGYQNAGTYKINFDASTLASGVYFYKLQTNSFIQVKKMMLLK
ncbi:MAG: T9SS type A sorting domain-containing protein [Bacteroidetes bacterium]|nr:T9SS type A sorting domain-containing protein [Bacteroidota bacterium]